MTDSYAYLFVKAIITLVFVLGLMYAAFYVFRLFVKKTSGGRFGKFSSPVRVVSSSFIGQKKNITIVEVAGEMLVLGVTPTTITCLTKIDNPDTIAELKKAQPLGAKSLFGFLGQ